jgi:hypothetical protein
MEQTFHEGDATRQVVDEGAAEGRGHLAAEAQRRQLRHQVRLAASPARHLFTTRRQINQNRIETRMMDCKKVGHKLARQEGEHIRITCAWASSSSGIATLMNLENNKKTKMPGINGGR